MTSAAQSSDSSRPSTRASDPNAERPNTVGFVWSAPLSIVTSAIGQSSSGLTTPANLNAVSDSDTLPHERGAHAHADTERGEAVAGARALAHRVGKLRDEPDAACRERMAACDRAPVGVEALVLGWNTDPVAPPEHLHREGLVQLEGVDLVDRQPGPLERPLRGRYRAESHQLRLDAGEGVRDQPEPRFEPELLGRIA